MSSNQCFHFTYLSRANKIREQGLVPRAEENSKGLKDTSSKVSFSDGKYAAAFMFANFYWVYEKIKSGERTAENSDTSQETIDKVKSTSSFEEYLKDGMYLVFDGTNIENTGGNKGQINPFDAGTKKEIAPENLKVCLLKNEETGEISYSKYDYALYLMCNLTDEDLAKMPHQNYIKKYKEDHMEEMAKFKNGNYTEKYVTLDKFCEVYRDEILQEELLEEGQGKITFQDIGKGTVTNFSKNISDATRAFEDLENGVKGQEHSKEIGED